MFLIFLGWYVELEIVCQAIYEVIHPFKFCNEKRYKKRRQSMR
ncbi:hypothetical protein GLYMA_18G185251v4 [Glycine max]|nr:hypothetical protein GLYMA_18G185251v4 [Glycine max]KAH1155076.1 hypothetical protein GYH30_050393 [Glycine max]